jgi:hypothetical protein
MSTVPARIAKGRGDGFGLSLPARNGVLFSPGHKPPTGLRVNGYLVEDYELKGIIPKWGELSRDIEDGRFNPILSSFL